MIRKGKKKSKTKNDSEWVSVQDKCKGSKAKRDHEGEENDEVWMCRGCKIRFD